MNEIERLAGSVMMCGFAGQTLPRELHSWVEQDSVAGLILFKRNIDSVQQVAAMVESFEEGAALSAPLLVGIDQEGGRVARLGDPIIELPPMRALGDGADPRLTALCGTVLGRQLRALGINLDFAPVLDVDTNPDNPVIGDRSFGASPQRVIDHAFAFAAGLARGGVLSCGKHFPGHGDTDLDSHYDLPRLRHTRERLEAVELRPFREAVGKLPSLMTAHVVFEELDHAPATLSPRVIRDLLRTDIGYEGAVFTDDLEMKAVSDRAPVEETGVLAIEAGCDILLVCSDVDAATRLREALVREADRSASFRTMLEQAGRRASSLRAQAAALPAPLPLPDALEGPEVEGLRDQIRQLA